MGPYRGDGSQWANKAVTARKTWAVCEDAWLEGYPGPDWLNQSGSELPRSQGVCRPEGDSVLDRVILTVITCLISHLLNSLSWGIGDSFYISDCYFSCMSLASSKSPDIPFRHSWLFTCPWQLIFCPTPPTRRWLQGLSLTFYRSNPLEISLRYTTVNLATRGTDL